MAGYTNEQLSAFRRSFSEYADRSADGLLETTFGAALNKCLTSIGLRPLTNVETAEHFRQINQNSVVRWPQFIQVSFLNCRYVWLRGHAMSKIRTYVFLHKWVATHIVSMHSPTHTLVKCILAIQRC